MCRTTIRRFVGGGKERLLHRHDTAPKRPHAAIAAIPVDSPDGRGALALPGHTVSRRGRSDAPVTRTLSAPHSPRRSAQRRDARCSWDRCIEIEPSLLNALQNRERGERLGRQGYAEVSTRV